MDTRLFTIGYTKSTAENFFARLTGAGVETLVDIRASNRSQLAGFAKMPDLAFFLDRVAGIAYRHEPLLTPTKAMMRAYRRGELTWQNYVSDYQKLLSTRQVAAHLETARFNMACLLCSEPTADTCHRRVAAEYLAQIGAGKTSITHL